MIDKKTAYELLGVKKGCTKNDIEKRFSIILKRHKAESLEGTSSIDIEQLTEAYNLLMGYTETTKTAPVKENPVLKKVGIDQKKLNNFLYYYKVHIIIGILIVIAVFFTVKSSVNRVDPDINVAFVGAFYYENSDAFSKEITQAIPEIKAAGVDQAFLYPDDKSEQANAMLMKATVIFAAQDVDVYILDKKTYETYAKQGAFKSIDSIAEKLGIDKAANSNYVLKAEDEGEAHLYGIDITGCKLFEKAGIAGNEKIAALGVRGKFNANAEKLLALLVKK